MSDANPLHTLFLCLLNLGCPRQTEIACHSGESLLSVVVENFHLNPNIAKAIVI
jgi:hypothetical protein